MVSHLDVWSSVGYSDGTFLQQLGLLHTPHLHPHLHQTDTGLQPEHCEGWGSLSGGGGGGLIKGGHA